MTLIREKNQISYVLNEFKGLNRDGEKFNMPRGWLWDLLNGYVTRSVDGQGAVQQRHGLSKYNSTVVASTTTKIRFMMEARWNTGAKNVVIRAGDAWRYYTAGGFTAFDSGRGSDVSGQAVMFNNEILYVDGGHPRRVSASFTPQDLSVDSSLPNATAIHVHRNRVWLNDPSSMQVFGSRVRDAISGSAWSTANDSVILDLSYVLTGGDEVIGFATFADVLLLIFCNKNVVVYEATEVVDNISLVGVIPIGCLSRNAFAIIGNDLIWPRQSGVKTFSSSQAYQKLDHDELSRAVSTLYRSYVDRCPDKGAISGAFYNALNHYYLTIPTSATTSETLVYSADVKNFVGRFNFHANPYSWVEAADGSLYIGMDDGFVYKYDPDTTTDDDNAISFILEFPYLGAEAPHRFKAPHEIQILMEANQDTQVTVTLDYLVGYQETDSYAGTFDIEATQSFWNEAVWDSSLWDQPGRNLFPDRGVTGRGKLIGVKVEHAVSESIIRFIYMFLRAYLEGEE